MSEDFVLNAVLREDAGKGASRRLRRLEGQVPAIVYGGEKAPANIQVPHKDLLKQLENEAFYSHVITLKVGGDSETVLLKDLQRHPAKPLVLHADFIRVSMDKEVTVNVPLHFTNEEACKGVKEQGGSISRLMNDLAITCLPGDLPEYIEVDMLNVELDQIVHISDLKLPAGVTSVDLSHGEDHDNAVVSVNKLKGVAVEDEEGTEAEAEAGEEGETPAE
ncbi:MAG: 50S ribosomal protein L25/general stress protein Ctc [Gammaproteobacteria bacterium]|uniref:50S ribosomal protein L25/general stress protein Ctc n=1 Tax=Pseudomaricurvus alcaniphilus TaxID=1166482 RepID=UPI00140A16BB|nr:50S ribosomal protein L25/general stress protein Ctc [Pseudomaricurvus alcaniphilus]MBR9911836.1 50S ribosomal protein L25/general stress protein Ctc [Gammaproteobacteria bacterium]NHN39265.1 50S ribosomal protein L25/general stress protein Ctc [Pseudomaricurvus alcaniphilus]